MSILCLVISSYSFCFGAGKLLLEDDEISLLLLANDLGGGLVGVEGAVDCRTAPLFFLDALDCFVAAAEGFFFFFFFDFDFGDVVSILMKALTKIVLLLGADMVEMGWSEKVA